MILRNIFSNDRADQTVDGLRNHFRGNSGIVDDERVVGGISSGMLCFCGAAGILTGQKIVLRKGGDTDSSSVGSLYDLLVGGCGGNMQEKVKSGMFPGDFDSGCEGMGADMLQQEVPLISVKFAHPVDMLFKISVSEKSRQGVLFEV